MDMAKKEEADRPAGAQKVRSRSSDAGAAAESKQKRKRVVGMEEEMQLSSAALDAVSGRKRSRKSTTASDDKGKKKRKKDEKRSVHHEAEETRKEPGSAVVKQGFKDVLSRDISGSKHVKVFRSFDEMDLKPELLHGIYAFGFEKPSSIQQRAIVPIVRGRDLIAQSQSGTGKTAVFCIGVLQVINTKEKQTQALILSPTRELAEQTQKVLKAVGDPMNVQTLACIGGTKIGDDMKELERGIQVVSGTPGRVYDLIKRQNLKTEKIKQFVIDEADELLQRGFLEQMYDIYRYLPSTVQVVLISATMPSQVLKMAEKFMHDPILVLVRRDELTLKGIKQFYIQVEEEKWKFGTLCDLYDMLTITQCVIFCNTREKVDILARKMRENGFTVCAMHGDMPQKEREDVMNEFRSGASRLLITTDVWGRGIDVQQVSLVICYDLPFDRELYLHRIGRSGRFGRRGIAINFVTDEDQQTLFNIERHYRIRIPEMPVNIGDLM